MPAATATTRRAAPIAKALAARRKVSEERLDLEHKLAPLEATAASLDATLKEFAADAGGSFKEDFGARGHVSASGPVAAEFKGEVPVLVTEVWNELTPAERKGHVKSGLIKMNENWGRASNGRVTAKALKAA